MFRCLKIQLSNLENHPGFPGAQLVGFAECFISCSASIDGTPRHGDPGRFALYGVIFKGSFKDFSSAAAKGTFGKWL